MLVILIKQLFPDPKHCYGSCHTKHEIGEITFTKQLDIQQMADKCPCITANNTYKEIHTTAFTFATHDAVGYIPDEYTCKYRPRREDVISTVSTLKTIEV